MKKFWKITISIILLLIIGGAGTAYYLLKVKTYDIADEEVKEISESEYEILLPDESTEIDEQTGTESDSEVQQGDAAQDHSTEATSDSTSQETEGQPSSGSGNKEDNSSASEVTVASIKQKYYPSFESLEAQANGKIDALVGQAYQEFQQKRKNGESISVGYFYQKYTSAAAALEGKTDAAFHKILNAVQNDLAQHGYSKSHANSFLEEYEAQKKSRETALLNKAKEAL